jgi:hypothetical protein
MTLLPRLFSHDIFLLITLSFIGIIQADEKICKPLYLYIITIYNLCQYHFFLQMASLNYCKWSKNKSHWFRKRVFVE